MSARKRLRHRLTLKNDATKPLSWKRRSRKRLPPKTMRKPLNCLPVCNSWTWVKTLRLSLVLILNTTSGCWSVPSETRKVNLTRLWVLPPAKKLKLAQKSLAVGCLKSSNSNSNGSTNAWKRYRRALHRTKHRLTTLGSLPQRVPVLLSLNLKALKDKSVPCRWKHPTCLRLVKNKALSLRRPNSSWVLPNTARLPSCVKKLTALPASCLCGLKICRKRVLIT